MIYHPVLLISRDDPIYESMENSGFVLITANSTLFRYFSIANHPGGISIGGTIADAPVDLPFSNAESQSSTAK
jgi:hypothetical protein